MKNIKNRPHKILVVRNDKLGDFMLAFPSFILLKQALPESQIHALIPSYTLDMAQVCPAIDSIIIDPGKDAGLSEQWKLLQQIKNYDAVITLHSTFRIGLYTFLARIPYRLAPASKIAQIFYNQRLVQRRSRSEKPEYIYNLDVVRQCLTDFNLQHTTLPSPPYLHFPDEQVSALREQFCKQHHIDPESLIIFIHPGSGGSANNLSLLQYSRLAELLKSRQGHTVVITAGPGENAGAKRLSEYLSNTPHLIYISDKGLVNFAKHIQFADLFISGSTGPLHIAGALDRPTAAFYTRRRSATALRWQTLNNDDKRLAFSPDEKAEPEDMSAIDIDTAAEKISQTFLL